MFNHFSDMVRWWYVYLGGINLILTILKKITMRTTYSNSFLDFLQRSENKIANVLYRLNNKRYKANMLTSSINYITFRGDGTISFLPEGKECKYTDSGTWSKEGRQNGKPAKVIKKLFTDRALLFFTDKDFENFANEYKSKFNDDGYVFGILKSGEIPAVYGMEIEPGGGSLSNSCMNGGDEKLAMYENCKNLSILVLKNKADKLCGRSLIWTVGEEIVFMDRIYVNNDFVYDKFISYAEEQKMWRKKEYKTYYSKTVLISPEGEEVEKVMKINTDTNFSEFPYIDTFSYGGDGYLTNKEGEQYTYNNTDGTRDGDEDNHDGQAYDDINDEWIDEESAAYIDSGERRYRDRMTHIDEVVFIGDSVYYKDDSGIVEVDGDWYTVDDEKICEIDGEYYLTDDCVYSDFSNEYHHAEDCVYSEEHSTYILKEDAVEVCGNYFHKDDVKEV